ncbi:hypothetical protein L9F63_002623 [Diploptera punctata]|uniref:Ion transport domain-containing protein n=1 Tax=Diploptera punctata TaxID=6984 RepID=A0AAD7ZTK0_DIPPU|nr:hypothetical protein L9F63_002623 [Diploptera punctata]
MFINSTHTRVKRKTTHISNDTTEIEETIQIPTTESVTVKPANETVTEFIKNNSSTTESEGSVNTISEMPEELTIKENTTTKKTYLEDKSDANDFVKFGLSVMVFLFALREVMQLLSATKQYVRRATPILRFAIIVPTIILCLDVFGNEVQHHCASIAILLAWFEFLLTMGCLPRLSIPLQMLQTVSWTFIKFMSFYSPLIIAFSLCFYTMLRNSKKDIFYTNFGMSILHIFLMFNGEYEASDTEFDLLNITSHIVLVVFILLMGIVLLNLLSGLAVSDTQAIKNDAETLSLIARVRLISNIENLVLGAADSKWIIPRVIKIFTPNLCAVFKCYPDKHVHVFPNRTKGYICLDDTEPKMNTPMSREILKNALKQIGKKNVAFPKPNESIQGAVIRAWGSDNGALVSKRVKDLCEQQEVLAHQLKEFKDMYESKLTRVEEEMKTAFEGVAGEVGNRYDLLSAKQEKIGMEIADKKADMREVLRSSQSGLQDELMKQTERMLNMEKRLVTLEETVYSTRDTVQEIFSFIVSQQRK